MKVVPPEDFLRTKRKPDILDEAPTSLKLESPFGEKKKKPRTSVIRPRLSFTIERSATSFECAEFWRYFQNTSQLALVVPGGGDAVIGRTEARQLLANFRGTNVESISKTDSGLMHICGLSVRQLHDFVNDLWRMGSIGMSVIKDFSVGSTKGLAKKILLRSQKKRIDEHIHRHSVSVLSALPENDDYLELGTDGDSDTREELPSPHMSPMLSPLSMRGIGRMHRPHSISFSQLGDLDSSFEDEVKLDTPTMRVMKSSELEFFKSETVRRAPTFFEDKRYSPMTAITSSLKSWALEDDVLSLGDFQLDDDYDTDSSLEFFDDGKCDGQSVADGSLSKESRPPGSGMPTPIPSNNLEQDSEEIIYFDGFDTPRRASLSFSFSMSERLATIMHAPVGV